MSKEFPVKVRQKLNYKYFYKKSNCSTESFRHVESSFDNFTQNSSQTFAKKFDPSPKTSEKPRAEIFANLLENIWSKY